MFNLIVVMIVIGDEILLGCICDSNMNYFVI